MTIRRAVAALLCGALAGPVLAAAPPGCRGTLSGAVKGAFTCVAGTRRGEGGQLLFLITPKEALPGVPQYAPGAFELPEPLEARTYALDELGMGLASVAAEGGALYVASRTSQRRGEVALALRSVRKGAPGGQPYEVRGSYRARLVPAGAGKSGEVVVEVTF